jgi:hypothetical protein
MFRTSFQRTFKGIGRRSCQTTITLKKKLMFGYSIPIIGMTAFGACFGFYKGATEFYYHAHHDSMTEVVCESLLCGIGRMIVGACVIGLLGLIWPITIPTLIYDYGVDQQKQKQYVMN